MNTARQRPGPGALQQRGMAVIVAMLVVAIVAVIAAGLIMRQSSALRTLRGEQLRAQVAMAVDAAIEHAAVELRADAAEQLTTVSTGRWARPILLRSPLPVQLQLRDAQAVFNLRNLVREGRPDLHEQAVFARLCSEQGLSPGECERVRRYVVARITGGGNGSGPLPLQDIATHALPDSDLQRVQALQRVLALLPAATVLNINTSDAQVLAAALPAVSPARLQALLAERQQGHWFINSGDIAFRLQLTQAQMQAMRVGIHSEWFLATGQVQADDVRVDFQALIWREHRDNGVRIQRMWTRVGA